MEECPECPFDCVVITAANERQAQSYVHELAERQRLGVLPAGLLLLSVADPKGARVGSGGGTLNALVQAVRSLCERAGDGAAQSRWCILCVHSGGDSQRSPSQSVCGKAWSSLNCVAASGHLLAPVDLLCFRLFRLCRGLAKGSLVVASSDVLLILPDPLEVALPLTGVWGLAIAANQAFGPQHGVYVTDGGVGGPVRRFLQKASPEELRAAGAMLPAGDELLVDSGVVALDSASVTKLLELSCQSPFDGCVGAEGASPFRFELYSDLMLALGGVMDQEAYLAMPGADRQAGRTRAGRELLWSALQETDFTAVVVPGARFAHLGTTAELLAVEAGSHNGLRDVTRHFSLLDAAASTRSIPGAVCVNSVLESEGAAGAGAVIEHCRLSGAWSAGPGALLSGLRLQLPELHVAARIAVQQLHLAPGSAAVDAGGPRAGNEQDSIYVLVVFGVDDPVKEPFCSPKARLCGKPWHCVLKALGASASDVWSPEVAENDRCLWSARLYPPFRRADAASIPLLLLQAAALGSPVVGAHAASWRDAPRRSLSDLLDEASPSQEFAWRRQVHDEVLHRGLAPSRPVLSAEEVCWDVVCVTARLPAHAEAYKLELLRHTGCPGLPTATLVLAAGDPGALLEGAAIVAESHRVGSGGATLNALMLVAEHLSALGGDNTVDMASLRGKRVLVLHVGAEQRMPAFSWLPTRGLLAGTCPAANGAEAVSSVSLLLHSLGDLARSCPPGLFVVSSEDWFLRLNDDLRTRFVRAACRAEPGSCGTVTALATAASAAQVVMHGVYALGEGGVVRRVVYRPCPKELSDLGLGRTPERFAKVCGVAFFDSLAAEQLLHLAFDAAFEACSYIGIDNGAQAKGFSLYLDLVACLATEATAEEFGRPSHVEGQLAVDAEMRQRLWQRFHAKVDLRVVLADSPDNPDSLYASVRTACDYNRLVTGLPLAEGEERLEAQAFVEGMSPIIGEMPSNSLEGDAAAGSSSRPVVINSIMKGCYIGAGAVVESSLLQRCMVGAGALCSGMKRLSDLQVPGGLALQQISLLQAGASASCGAECCVVVFDLADEALRRCKGGTFLGLPWSDFLLRAGVSREDLWPGLLEAQHTLAAARLFPALPVTQPEPGFLWLQLAAALRQKPLVRRTLVDIWRRKWLEVWRTSRRLAMTEIMHSADVGAEFAWQRTVAAEANVLRARALLLQVPPAPLRHVIDVEVRNGRYGIVEVFDEVAADLATPPDVAARALAQVAEVLAAFGGKAGGLRSGSARNPRWQRPLARLGEPSAEARRAAVLEMRDLRRQWIADGPVALIRLARHYEAAAQVLIRTAMCTPLRPPETSPAAAPSAGEWVSCEAPARIDVAGGWTDTPPICYELGGAVVNLAVRVDGKLPIGSKARCIPGRFELVFEVLSSTGAAGDSSASGCSARPAVVCRCLADLEDYNSPTAPAALLKAAALYCGIVKVGPGAQPLEQQLRERGGGLQVVSWSFLPEGSGLGTSSILAGCVIRAMLKASGHDICNNALVDGVLVVEQMLTTGGGWQDQVGGLFGGAKIARCAAQLPVCIKVEAIPLDQQLASQISERLILVFTGRPRLAKHLLQNVIRQWYGRLPVICNTLEGLMANAEAAAEALRAGDLQRLGACLSTYWEQKKQMAPGCEPPGVAMLRARLGPILLGASLAGAGGGGFMVLLMREPAAEDAVREALASCTGLEGATLHKAEIDFSGLTIS